MLSYGRCSAAAFVAACALVGCHRAPSGPPVQVPVIITSTEQSVRVDIRTRVGDRPIGSCDTPCARDLPLGDYIVEVHGAEDVPSAEERLRVTGPTKAVVVPGSKDAEVAGAIAGTLGIVALVVGTFWGLDCLVTSTHHDCSTPLWVFGVGFFGTPAGWAVFANAHTSITAERTSKPLVTLTPGGGSVGWTFSF